MLNYLAKDNQSLPDDTHDEKLQRNLKNRKARFSCSAVFVNFSTSATRIFPEPISRSFTTFCQIVGGLEDC